MAALKKVLFNIGSASNANEDVCDKNSRLDDMILDSTVKSNRIAEKSPQKASESQETISIEGGKSPIKEPINLDLGKDFMPLFDEKYQEGEVEGGLIHKVVSQKAKEVFSSVMSNVTSDQSAPNSHNSSQTVENKQKEIETRAHEEDSLLEASNISNEVVPREEEEDMIRDDVRDDIICMIFDLPKSTKFYRDFSCAIASSFAMHGRMYPANKQICFYSNVFGRERKILIPYESITSISKTRTMMFQSAIKINTNTEEEYIFTSFWGNNCEKCHDLIIKIRNRVLGLTSSSVTITSPDMSPVLSPVEGASVPQASLVDSEVLAVMPSSSSNDTESTFSPITVETSVSGESDPKKEDEDQEVVQREQEQVVDTNGGMTQEKDTGIKNITTNTKNDSSPCFIARTLGSKRNSVSDIGSEAPKDLSMTMLLEEKFDLSADEFMNHFLIDNAPFSLEEFNRRIGSSEITCNSWKTPTEITQDKNKNNNNMGCTRSLQFRVPIEAPIGPKSTMVDMLQCHKKNSDGTTHVIETSTRLVDIPYGDYFSVEDRWTITNTSTSTSKRGAGDDGKDDDGNGSTTTTSIITSCMLRIEFKIVFSKSTFWKNKIESRAKSENKQKHEKWVHMAKEFLLNQTKGTPAASIIISSTPRTHIMMTSPPSKEKATNSISKIKSPPNTPLNRCHLKRKNDIQNLSPQELKRFQKKVLLPWLMLLIMLLVVIHLHLAVSRMEKSLLQMLDRLDQLQQTLEHFKPEYKQISST